MSSEVNVQSVEKKKRDKKKLIALLLLIILAGVAVVFFSFYEKGEDKTAWLRRQLKSSSEKTIEIEEKIIITEPLVINGDKTISGTGTIVYKPKISEKFKLEAYRIPDNECQATAIADLSEMSAMFEVSDGSSLTLSGSVTVDANSKALGMKVNENGTLVISESVVLTDGLGANIFNKGSLTVSGGKIEAEEGYNIMTNGTMVVTDGEVTGSGKSLMNIVANGTVSIEGGMISGAKGTNVYLVDGKVSVSGGTIDSAVIDNVFVAKGEIEVTGGTLQKGKHGVHNVGTAAVTGGTYTGNTNNLYNEGIATAKNLSFGNSLAHNIVNTGKNAQMEMTDAIIEAATTHGVYNVRGAKLDVENLTVKSALSKGIHNGGGFIDGKNITVVRAGEAGIGNEIEKGWTEDGEVTIDGLKVLKANNYNLLNTSGVMTVNDAELGLITSHSIQVTGGTLNLKDIEIAGTTGTASSHGIYMLGGTINAENVNIARSVSRGIQNRGGEFNGKNITITKVAGTAIGNLVGVDDVSNGTITIDGLTLTDVTGYAIQNTNAGIINILNGDVEVSNTTGVRIDDGAINLTNVKLTGVTSMEESENQYNGITAMGGNVALKGVTFKDMLGRAISNDGANVTGTNVVVNGTDGGGVVTLKGTTKITKLTTSGVYGYNVDVQSGSATIIDGTLNSSETTNVRVKEGTLTLENVLVDGAPKVVEADGTVNQYNGITATSGKLILKNVTVQNTAGRGLNCTGAAVTGENVVVKNAVGTSVYNSDGSIDIDGFEVSGGTGYNVDVKSGSVSLNNATIHETKTTSVHIKSGSLSLKNTLIDGAPEITDEKGKVTQYNGITADGGKVSLDTVTIRDTAGRNLNNNASKITGKNVVLENAGKTSLYNDGTITLDGLEIKGHEEIEAYNVDNAGTLTLKNATLCQTGTSSINLKQDSVTTLENVVVEGTTKGHAVYVRKNATLKFDTLIVKNSKARALSNGNADGNVDGGTVTGKNLVVDTTGGTAIANVTGTMKIDGLSISGRKGYGIDNSATTELKNVEIAAYEKAAAINNTGNLTVDGGIINAGTYYGIKHEKGSLTLAGTLTVNTSNNAVYLGTDEEVETLSFAEGATFISESRINLPDGHVVTVLGEIGNTAEQPIVLAPAVTTEGTVLVDTPSAEMAQKLAAANAFKPKGVSAIVGEGDNADKLVAGTVVFDEMVQEIPVSTWAELKKAIEDVEDGDNLNIILLNSIDETGESVITVGLNAVAKVNLTDNGNGYTIKRTDLTKALFGVYPVSIMTIDGTLVIDGASNKTTTSSEAIFLNEGTLTIGSGVTVKNGYKSGSNNSISGSGKSAGAIESTGTLNINGTITASGSGNHSAITVLSGTLTTNGAKLNNNISRAARIASGTVVLTDTEICHNTVTANGTSGGGLLVDGGSITVNGGAISYNVTKATESSLGAGIYLMGSATLNADNCTFEYNEAGGYGGAIGSVSTGKVKLIGCTLNNNKAGTHGAAIRVNKKDSTSALEMTNCTVKDNTATSKAGAIISNAKKVTLTGCTFSGNIAKSDVGALYFNETASQEVTLTNCNISGNTGATGTGGIRIDTGKLTLNDCTVSGNTVTSGNAGGIWATSSKAVTLDNCNITGNSAKNGGALYIDDSGKVTLMNCTVTGNTVTEGGAGFYISHASADVIVTGGSISGNTASGRGGAARVENGTLNISESCTISNNTAMTSGGAFFIQLDGTKHGKVYMTSSIMKDNSSNGSGQTIHVKGTLSLKTCTINDVSSINADEAQIYQEGSPNVTNEE